MTSGSVILNNPNGTVQAKDLYESVEFAVTTGTTDYDVDTQQATFKAVVANPYYLELGTDQQISIKFNSTSNHAITVKATDSIRVFDRQEIRNIYITNASGSTANIRMYLK